MPERRGANGILSTPLWAEMLCVFVRSIAHGPHHPLPMRNALGEHAQRVRGVAPEAWSADGGPGNLCGLPEGWVYWDYLALLNALILHSSIAQLAPIRARSVRDFGRFRRPGPDHSRTREQREKAFRPIILLCGRRTDVLVSRHDRFVRP